MTKLPYLLRKELLVLTRDRVGLAFIFLMPLVVLLVVTLVQDGAFKSVSKFQIRAAVVDEDGSDVSRSMVASLAQAEGMILMTERNGMALDRHAARDMVQRKEVQAFVVFPKDLGKKARAAAKHWAQGTAAGEATDALRVPAIETYFDPGISGGYQAIFSVALKNLTLGKEFELGMQEWGESLPRRLAEQMPSGTKLPRPKEIPIPEFVVGQMLDVAEPANANVAVGSDETGLRPLPGMTQFNVPAYAVFAIFFIVIPISSCLLRERNEGTLMRMLTMQVRADEMIAGKLLTYFGISLLQFFVMLAAGMWLLPILGTEAFVLSANALSLIALTLATSLAAVGYALALASTATSTEQSAMIGSTSVVLFAALGGVMVPVFFMPPLMQQVSAFTPINWAVTAYQDLFCRHATFADIGGRLSCLIAFGCAGIAWSWRRLFKRD